MANNDDKNTRPPSGFAQDGLDGAGKMQPVQMIQRPSEKELQNGLNGAERLQAKPKPAQQPPIDSKGK